MDTRAIRPHPLLPPLLIGIISLLGICVILASTFLPKQEAPIAPTWTPTPFKYQFLGTETLIPTVASKTATSTAFQSTPSRTPDITDSDTETQFFPAATLQNRTFTEEFFSPTVTTTPNPIFNGTKPMTAGTYDGADPHIIRNGNWSSQRNADAVDGKLLVSNTVGNFVAFRFTGVQMGLGYQSSDNAGEITINIDSSELTIPQLVGNLWNSDELEPGTHYVIITHTSGSQINIDYVQIP